MLLWTSTRAVFPYTSLFRSVMKRWMVLGLMMMLAGPALADPTADARGVEEAFARIRGRVGERRPREHHRSEEHTSELQSPDHLVCRLLLEKKKDRATYTSMS